MIEKDFLDAIAANPDEDVSRLIYADWLEEQGDPRGEFIRLQCELVEMDCEADGFEETDGRMRDLLIAHEEEWTAPIRSIVNNWSFQKGLLDYAEIDANAFVEHAETLFSTGLFRFITLKESHLLVDQLAKCPWLLRVHGLCLDGNSLGERRLQSLLDTNSLVNLRRLSLAQNQFGDAGAVLIARSNLPQLEVLDLSWNKLRNDGIIAISESSNVSHLKVLFVSNNEIRLKGAQALATSQHLRHLEMLDIQRNPLPAAAIELLQARFCNPCVLYVS